MLKQLLTLTVFLGSLNLFSQESLNLELLGTYPYTDIDRGQKLNDIWGYVDESGNEYALVGLTIGFSVVALDQGDTPVEVARIPGPPSTWRDVKTFGNHAFITHDNTFDFESQGLLVVDLSDIENGNAPYYSFNDDSLFTRAHNIYIDENGIAYLTGADYMQGGAYMIDVTNPDSLFRVGVFDEAYLHDCVTRGDTMWGGAIYQGALMAVDVSDKANPTVIGLEYTPSLFTHNCWISDDGNYVYTTDERSDAYIASYDVSDIGNIKYLDKIQSFYSKNTIPHNTHFINEYLVTSYYRDGVQITDVKHPDNMIDVGHYDTSPQFEGDGFQGAWGAYPYLPSGRIIVSDMQNGLFVFKPNYQRACYLHITVVDDETGLDVIGAHVDVLDKLDSIGVDGVIKTGTPISGEYTITVSMENYSSQKVKINLQNGEITEVEIRLKEVMDFDDLDKSTIVIGPNPTADYVSIQAPGSIKGPFDIMIYDMLGRHMSHTTTPILDFDNKITLPHASGEYIIKIISTQSDQSIERKIVKY